MTRKLLSLIIISIICFFGFILCFDKEDHIYHPDSNCPICQASNISLQFYISDISYTPLPFLFYCIDTIIFNFPFIPLTNSFFRRAPPIF